MNEYQLEIWNGNEYEPQIGAHDDGRILAKQYRQRQWLKLPAWLAAFGQNGQRTHAWRVVKIGEEHQRYRRPRKRTEGNNILISDQAKAYADWLVKTHGKDCISDIPMWSLRSGRGNAYDAHRALRGSLTRRGVSTIGFLLLQQDRDE